MTKTYKKWKIFAIFLIVLLALETCFIIVMPKIIKDDNDTAVQLTPATIRGKVLTDLGEMLMANIIVEDSDGATSLYTTNLLSGYEIELEEGEYTLHYTRGMQYSTVTKTIKVENFKNYYLEDIRLIELYNAESKGYYAGDLHQHTIFSDGTHNVEELIRADISAGLSWAVLSDHNDNTGISEWMQTDRLPYDIVNGEYVYFTPIAGVEITTGYGHFQSIGNSAVVEQWDIDLDLGENPYEEVEIIVKEIVRNGGIAQLNHPYSTGGMGFNNYNGLWELIDNFSTIEIWNGYFEPCGYIPPEGVLNQNRRSMLKWFELLNQGHILFATGGTDLHSYNGSYNPALYMGDSKAYEKLLKKTGQYAGMPTTFAYLSEGMSEENVLTAVKNGNTFISNGPLIFANIDGKTYGQTVLNDKRTINIEMFCRDGLETLNIYKNGVQVKSVALSGTDFHEDIQLTDVSSGDWIVFEVYGTGVYYAITNPIFFA
ncbi:MAG: CehA/McbA family metallohydrolase [Bacilli bacterium]|nr:CehA/McbA family metallohydrolase [Bacilli bacterium]